MHVNVQRSQKACVRSSSSRRQNGLAHLTRAQVGIPSRTHDSLRSAFPAVRRRNFCHFIQAVATQQADAKQKAAKPTSEYMLQTLTLWLLKVSHILLNALHSRQNIGQCNPMRSIARINYLVCCVAYACFCHSCQVTQAAPTKHACRSSTSGCMLVTMV